MSGISAATQDLLDPTIPGSYANYQNDPDEKRFPHYRATFCTDPVLWKRHEPPPWAFSLSWAEFKYTDATDSKKLDALISSTDPGLYVFYIRPEKVINQFPRFALYVGISNEGNSNRPLRTRLKDYLPERIAAKKKRKQIDRMVRLYYGVLWVAYTLSNRPSAELEKLEQALHGFFYPVYDRRDFPVDIKDQQKAFGTI